MNKLIFIIVLFSLYRAVSAEPTGGDTVWTKSMWPDKVKNIMFLPDSNRILVVGKNYFYFLDVKTGTLINKIHTNREYDDVAVSSDGKFMFSLDGIKYDLITYLPLDTIKSFGTSFLIRIIIQFQQMAYMFIIVVMLAENNSKIAILLKFQLLI